MFYLICYDIRNPKRLRRTAKKLENYGIRVQKSFFQCEMSSAMLDELVKDIKGVINLKVDYFFIYPICEKCAKKVVIDGKGSTMDLEDFLIL